MDDEEILEIIEESDNPIETATYLLDAILEIEQQS